MRARSRLIGCAALACLTLAPAAEGATTKSTVTVAGTGSSPSGAEIYAKVKSTPACTKSRRFAFTGIAKGERRPLGGDVSSRKGYAGLLLPDFSGLDEVRVTVKPKKLSRKRTCGADSLSVSVHGRQARATYPTSIDYLTLTAGPGTIGAVARVVARPACRANRTARFFAIKGTRKEPMFTDVASRNGFFGGRKAVPGGDADGIAIVIAPKRLSKQNRCGRYSFEITHP